MKYPISKIILYYIKPYPVLISVIFISAFLYAIFESVNIAVLFPLLNTMLGTAGSAGKTGGVLKILSKVPYIIPVKDPLLAVLILFLLANLIKNISYYLREVFSYIMAQLSKKRLQKQIFEKIIKSDYHYFLDNKSGSLVYKASSAPLFIAGLMMTVPLIMVEILKSITIIALLFSISFNITLTLILIGIAFNYLTRKISKNISYHSGKGKREINIMQNILITELVNGIRQVKIFLAETRWLNNFKNATNKYYRLAVKDGVFTALPARLLEIASVAMICVIAIILKRIYPDSFVNQLPIIGVYAFAIQRIIPSLSTFGKLRMQFMGLLPPAETVYETLHEDISIIKDGMKELGAFNSGIRFDNVCFAYPGRHIVLNNINFEIRKSESLAIVGPSGSGKSTIIDLLVRLYVPQEGSITVDGININDLKITTLLEKIGFVTQDTFIFNATVAENIAFGRGVRDRQKIIDAAKIANAHDFIMRLPQRYDTVIGERGMKISGGERQRIAIARAIFNRPEILIFDEATSALDSHQEALVQAAINKIKTKHTIIIIAHRLSTIMNMNVDNIIVIDKGKIVESGKHADLINNKGIYRELYNKQFSLDRVLEI